MELNDESIDTILNLKDILGRDFTLNLLAAFLDCNLLDSSRWIFVSDG